MSNLFVQNPVTGWYGFWHHCRVWFHRSWGVCGSDCRTRNVIVCSIAHHHVTIAKHIHIVGQHVAAFQVISHFVGKVMGLRHLERWMLTNSRWFVYNCLLFKMWFPVVSLQFKIKANHSMLIWTALKGSFGIMVPKKGISPENGMIFQVKNSDEKIERKQNQKNTMNQWHIIKEYLLTIQLCLSCIKSSF